MNIRRPIMLPQRRYQLIEKGNICIEMADRQGLVGCTLFGEDRETALQFLSQVAPDHPTLKSKP